MSHLRVRELRLLLGLVAAAGCDGGAGREAAAIASPDTRSAAARPVPKKEVVLTKKLKPFVIDLGGRQARAAVGCALTVGFSSVGTGTDTVARARIEHLLEADPAVAEIEQFVVGREGETAFCVRLHQDSEADRLFEELRVVSADAYRVSIRSKSGKQFQSQQTSFR
jgi:hypothetical protein